MSTMDRAPAPAVEAPPENPPLPQDPISVILNGLLRPNGARPLLVGGCPGCR